jgi:hypothetical protein
MEPYDMVCLSNDFDYFCFPCGTLKLRNEPKPLFNPTIEISKSKNLGLRKNLSTIAGKMKLELCYSENAPKCAMCKDYI